MTSPHQQGRVGEAAIVYHFVQNGYDVYLPQFGNTDNDMIVGKNGELSRVEVKSTRNLVGPSYVVQLKTVRPNKTKNTIKNFDGSRSDILAVYIVPEDRVVLLNSKDYDGKTVTSIRAQK